MTRPTKTILLSEPLRVGGKDVTELTMTKGTAGDLVDANVAAGIDFGGEPPSALVELHLYALLCKVPAEDLRAMDTDDYEGVMAAYSFLRREKKSRPEKT